MKYLVISDTHGFLNNAINIIEKLKPDFVLHLGDMLADCEDLEAIFPRQKFIFVKGNNDYWARNSLFPDERVFVIENKNFFVCHGHKYHVKSGTELLRKKAKEINADIVLYGHTHVKKLEYDGDTIIMNPGSVKSYGLITIDNDKINAEIKDYE